MPKNNKESSDSGFGHIGVLFIVAVLIIVSVVGWYVYKNHSTKSGTTSNNSNIKPQLTGIINQSGSIPSAYSGVVKNWDVTIKWSQLQPNSANDFDTKSIDSAVATSQSNHLHLFLNVQAGQFAPKWVENLPVTSGKVGPYKICSDHGKSPICGMMPHFWESDYQQAYASLMQQLAAKYDQNPVISEVGIAGCMTIFNEPLLRNSNDKSNSPLTNTQSFAQAGITASGDATCEHAQIDAVKVWTHTQAYLSFNAYEQWDGSGFTHNEDFTESLIDYCRQTLGQRCVLGNESVGNSMKDQAVFPCSDIGGTSFANGASMQRMYTKIKCVGPPIQFRSDTPAHMYNAGGSLAETIPWAISEGAAGYEPNTGYDQACLTMADGKCVTNAVLSTQDVANYNAQLAKNASPKQ